MNHGYEWKSRNAFVYDTLYVGLNEFGRDEMLSSTKDYFR